MKRETSGKRSTLRPSAVSRHGRLTRRSARSLLSAPEYLWLWLFAPPASTELANSYKHGRQGHKYAPLLSSHSTLGGLLQWDRTDEACCPHQPGAIFPVDNRRGMKCFFSTLFPQMWFFFPPLPISSSDRRQPSISCWANHSQDTGFFFSFLFLDWRVLCLVVSGWTIKENSMY